MNGTYKKGSVTKEDITILFETVMYSCRNYYTLCYRLGKNDNNLTWGQIADKLFEGGAVKVVCLQEPKDYYHCDYNNDNSFFCKVIKLKDIEKGLTKLSKHNFEVFANLCEPCNQDYWNCLAWFDSIIFGKPTYA